MIDTERKGEGVLVLTLVEPRLDAANAPVFKESVTATLAGGETRIVLDMSRVQFVDSSGLGALVGILKRLGAHGDLVLTGLAPAVARAFKLTRMDRVFVIHPDIASAVAHLKV